jgi:hypothetical protein
LDAGVRVGRAPADAPQLSLGGAERGEHGADAQDRAVFVGWNPPTGGDETLGLVDFAIFPHLDHPMLPHNTMANAEQWAATIGCPAYAIDNETAIKVVDGNVEVVSDGAWKLFTP